MAKEQERDELHRAIWQIANDLRGSVDGWDFKSYVLGMLFYRFISENLTSYINKEEKRTGNTNFDYPNISDRNAEFGRADTVKEKGFFILPSELFVNVQKKAKNDENLNETLSKVFKNIENSAKGNDSEDDLRGLFDDIDVNSNKLGGTVQKRNATLVKILEAIGGLKIGEYQNNTIATCVIVIKKSKKDNATLFIDASAEFVRGGNKNKLSDDNRKRILKAFIDRKSEDHFCQLIPNSEVAENDYNIAVSSYVEQENTTEEVDIEKLNAHIAEIVVRQNKLRTAIDEIVTDLEGGAL